MTQGQSQGLSKPPFPHLLDGANKSHLKAVPGQGLKLAQSPAEWAPRTNSLTLFCPLVRTSPSKSPPPRPHSPLGTSTSSRRHSLKNPAHGYRLQPETQKPTFWAPHQCQVITCLWTIQPEGFSDRGSMASFSDREPRPLPRSGRLGDRGWVPWKVTLRARQSAPGQQSQQARNPRN